MLQLRVVLPDEWENEEGLTSAGEEHMLMYRALLEKAGMHTFQVVRGNN